jgi:hypothetical protein
MDPQTTAERLFGDTFWKFYQRNPRDIFEVIGFSSQTIASIRNVLSSSFRFGVTPAFLHPYDNKSIFDIPNHRAAIYCAQDGYIFISLAWETIVPLFRIDLNTSERLAHQNRIARTLLHEIAVSGFYTYS